MCSYLLLPMMEIASIFIVKDIKIITWERRAMVGGEYGSVKRSPFININDTRLMDRFDYKNRGVVRSFYALAGYRG